MLQGYRANLKQFIKLEYLILAIIVLVGSVRFYVAAYLPIMGDGALHAYLTESIAASGSLPAFSNYPPAFHLNAAIFALFADENYKFIPAIFGVLNILVVYLFTREITGSRSASLIAAFFVAIFPYHILLSATFFMETTIIFFVFLTLYSHLRFYKTREKSWLLLTGIFAGIAVAMKQTAYLLPLVVVIQHFILELYARRSLAPRAPASRQALTFLIISILIAFPFIYYFFATTGTIIDPSNPLTRLGFVQPGDWDPAAVRLIYHSDLFERVHFEPFYSPERILEFYNPSSYYYTFHYSEALFVGLTILGSVFLLKRRPIFLMYVLVFIVIYHVGLNIVQHPRHFLFLAMMPFIPLASAVLLPGLLKNKRLGRAAAVGILAVILLSTPALYIDGVRDANSRFYSMGWLPTGEPITNLIDAYKFVKENSDPSDKVADPNSYEALYYADRQTFWLTPRGGADFYEGIRYHDEEKLNRSLIENNVKFLVVIHRFVTTGDLNTQQFIRHDDYVFIRDSSLFRLVFERPGVEVYEFIYHGIET